MSSSERIEALTTARGKQTTSDRSDYPEFDLTLDDFETARRRINSVLSPTPMKESQWLASKLQASGGRVFLKLDCLQPSGSFKIRGVLNSLLAYRETHDGQFPALVLAASGGSHGLATAYACHLLKVPACTIVIPENSAKPHIIDKLSSYGEHVVVVVEGRDFSEADLVVQRLIGQQTPGTALYIHPYADRNTVAGQGTIALEISEQIPSEVAVDVLIGSVGGGGLMSGVALCWRLLQERKPERRYSSTIIATVETEGADCWYRSVEQQKLVALDSIESICKTLGAKQNTPEIFRALNQATDVALRVSDRDTVAALLAVLDNERILVEPSCSCSVVAFDHLLKLPETAKAGNVCIIMCGSNTSLDSVLGFARQFGVMQTP